MTTITVSVDCKAQQAGKVVVLASWTQDSLCVGVPGSAGLGRNTGPLSRPDLSVLVYVVSHACARVGV